MLAGSRSTIESDDIDEALRRRVVRYDKTGDQHYDVISAFIKSLRGSDPDAALYWLFTMLEAGEDPEFIARRMVILASEDVGMADPLSLQIAVAAAPSPPVRWSSRGLLRTQPGAVHLASRPSRTRLLPPWAPPEAVATSPGAKVPLHLRGTGYWGARKLGHGWTIDTHMTSPVMSSPRATSPRIGGHRALQADRPRGRGCRRRALSADRPSAGQATAPRILDRSRTADG